MDFLELIHLLNSRCSLPQFYQSCHALIRRYMPADNFYIALVDTGGLRFPYYVDEMDPDNSSSIYPRAGWTAWVIDEGQRYWLAKDPSPPITPVGPLPHDWLGVPLLDRSGSCEGAVVCQTYRQKETYSEDHEHKLRTLADILAIALHTARQDRTLAMYRIASLSDELVDTQTLLASMYEILKSLIPAARKNILFARADYGRKCFYPVFWHDEKDSYEGFTWPLDQGFSGYAISEKRSSYLYEKHSMASPPITRTRGGTEPEYWLGTPLYSGDAVIGIVIIHSYKLDEPITKEDEYCLASVAPYIATALNRGELDRMKWRS